MVILVRFTTRSIDRSLQIVRRIVVRAKFFDLTKEACTESFKANMEKLLSHLAIGGKVKDESIRSLLFGDYVDNENFYDEVTDIPQLIRAMEG